MRLRINNIGALVSGRPQPARHDIDTIVIEDGVITAIGSATAIDDQSLDGLIDAMGMTVTPGLVDPHVHPVLGDYTPRHTAHGWIESYVHAGTTTMISAGEPHWPGRDGSAEGAVAIATAALLGFKSTFGRPAKVHAGALLFERGVTTVDVRRLADLGAIAVGEIGIASITGGPEARQLVDAARSAGLVVGVHTGGASIPGSGAIGAATIAELEPTVACHANGGPTCAPLADIDWIVEESTTAVEVVFAGNEHRLLYLMESLAARDELDRLQIGTDTPSGTGVAPLGLLRVIALAASRLGLDPALILAAATGTTAQRYGLDVGVLDVGRPADIVILDAPIGSEATTALGALAIGDVPAVAAVLIDGDVRVTRSRVTPPPNRSIEISGPIEGGRG
jgi:enamidase